MLQDENKTSADSRYAPVVADEPSFARATEDKREKSETVIVPETSAALAEPAFVLNLLDKHNIPLNTWGEGVAKTVGHLITEISSGESVLTESEDGELIRLIKVVSINITYTDELGKTYKLIESRQVFKDGRERKRNLGVSVAEKIKFNESPERAAKRAIQEELGIFDDITLSFHKANDIKRYSNSYPGLKTFYERHYYHASINREQYNRDGYTEKQSDKMTYFVWVQIEVDEI